MKKAIFLIGPTAIGKTALACQLYEAFPLKLISVDSVMIYKGLDIGSGKPSPSELKRYPHALIDICEPFDLFSVGDFLQKAKKEAENAFAEGKIPFFVGGTMLYFKALRDGLCVLPEIKVATRQHLQDELKRLGLNLLYERLQKVDPKIAMKLQAGDTQRILRALEIYAETGNTMSSYWMSQKAVPGLDVPIVTLALVPEDRAWLHHSIEIRFSKMLQKGLIEEVQCLLQRIPSSANALRSVGYRQVLSYLAGEITQEALFAKGAAATRQLAKRQLTWIRHWQGATELTAQAKDLVQKSTYLLMKEIQVK